MRFRLLIVPLASLVLLTSGCVTSTPQTRISKQRGLYRSFPAEAQRMISNGQVDIGFTPEMVLLALGKPGREFTRSGPEGESVVWVYFKRAPHGSFGFGVSSGSYSGVGVGTSVSLSTRNHPDDEFMRVSFQAGKVTSVETRVR